MINLPPKPVGVTVPNPNGLIIGRDLNTGKPIRQGLTLKAGTSAWLWCSIHGNGRGQFVWSDGSQCNYCKAGTLGLMAERPDPFGDR